jgi:hypothetical protein
MMLIFHSENLWNYMSNQISSIIVSIIGLIILYMFFRVANQIGAPNIFTFVGALMVFLILWNVARRLIRGL